MNRQKGLLSILLHPFQENLPQIGVSLRDVRSVRELSMSHERDVRRTEEALLVDCSHLITLIIRRLSLESSHFEPGPIKLLEFGQPYYRQTTIALSEWRSANDPSASCDSGGTGHSLFLTRMLKMEVGVYSRGAYDAQTPSHTSKAIKGGSTCMPRHILGLRLNNRDEPYAYTGIGPCSPPTRQLNKRVLGFIREAESTTIKTKYALGSLHSDHCIWVHNPLLGRMAILTQQYC
ncbi:hypothetical protein VNO77_20257 [Canavalia gladiata]|uniref:Uncharacterized protein n=1 Tax=Canavalia gladiata TaxID=3824 RepID=A0AAN9LNW2_CANGL